jgi:hypothetical protein
MLTLCFPNFLQCKSLAAELIPAGDSRTVAL